MMNIPQLNVAEINFEKNSPDTELALGALLDGT